MKKAKTEKKNMQLYFEQFASKHSVSQEIARKDSLPISLVDYRKVSNLVYPSISFFPFIKYIKASYINNFTVEMMMSY